MTRTVAVVLILSATFALALAMFISSRAAANQVHNVSSTFATTISVRPAGSFGFTGGGNPLTAADVAKIKTTPHVVATVSSVSDRLTNENSSNTGGFGGGGTGGTTSLNSPITPGSLGNRFGGGGNSSFGGGTFTLPVSVVGTTDPLNPVALSATSVTLTSGKAINGASKAYVADVGSTLASKNGLKVGSTFTAYKKTFTVQGIFKTNTTFADAQFVVPLRTEQALSGISGVTYVGVTVDELGNVQSTVTALQHRLGTSVADVSSSQTGTSATASTLNDIKTIATYGLIGAIIASAAILLMSTLMIVRERRREIGILKAFGSSNVGVVSTFVVEGLVLTLMAAVIGTVLGVALSNPILHLLQNTSSSGGSTPGLASGPSGFPGGGGPRVARFGGFGFGGGTLHNLHTVLGTSVAISAVGIAIAIAILGSAVPAYVIARVRPAEVMRSDS